MWGVPFDVFSDVWPNLSIVALTWRLSTAMLANLLTLMESSKRTVSW